MSERDVKATQCRALYAELNRDIEEIDNSAFASLWYDRAVILKDGCGCWWHHRLLMQKLLQYKIAQREHAERVHLDEQHLTVLEQRFGKQGLRDLCAGSFFAYVQATREDI